MSNRSLVQIQDEGAIIRVRNLELFYSEKRALQQIDMNIRPNAVTAFIGPSGCGKSTLLRCFNRLNDLIKDVRVQGEIFLEQQNIYDPRVDLTALRQKIGMVFQKPNPFPKSIYENVAFGLRLRGVRKRETLDEIVERSLRQVALWDEVKDRLHSSALSLSGGQQQRLVIGRAIAVEPTILLLDEPASALDPISTLKLEQLIFQLKEKYTIIVVTHNMQQASRISDMTAFLYLGQLIEMDETATIFTTPSVKQTEDYITGRYG
ncbi:MAG: phosphate ABC transporter ATP-binding protein PstB [Gammaproteobacteria bacterium]